MSLLPGLHFGLIFQAPDPLNEKKPCKKPNAKKLRHQEPDNSVVVGKYSKNHWFYRWNSISSLFETREKLERNTAQGSTIQRLPCAFPCSPRHAPKTSEKALRKAQNWSPKAPRDPPEGSRGSPRAPPGHPGTPRSSRYAPQSARRPSQGPPGPTLGAIWVQFGLPIGALWSHFGIMLDDLGTSTSSLWLSTA